ncbi:MAG: hypothetical protein ACREX3_04930 [Gammaproteobacteria bacterium]
MELRIEVTEQDNPHFYSLFHRGNELMAGANVIFDQLNAWRPPRLRIRSARRRLASIATASDDFWEKEFEPWELEATNFIFQPEYGHFPRDHATLFFLHNTQTMRHQLQRVGEHALSLRQNILIARTTVANQEGRLLAIAALFSSAVSFVLAALSFWID